MIGIARQVSVGQCIQKTDQILNFTVTQCRGISGIPVERRIAYVDIGLILSWQVVVLEGAAIRGLGIKAFGVDVAEHVKLQYIVE